MRPSSDELYQLIKSLDSAEKRYFKIYTNKHVYQEEKTYRKLFAFIEKKREVDDQAVRRQFKNERFIVQLSVVKNRLFTIILESLQAFYSGKSTRRIVNELFDQSEILYKKRLYKSSKKLLEKAKIVGRRYEHFSSLMDVFSLLRKISNSQGHFRQEIMKEEKDALIKLKNLNDYSNLSDHFFEIINSIQRVRDKKTKRQLESIINHSLMTDAGNALSYRAKYLYYNINGIYYASLGDSETSFRYNQEGVAFMESDPDLMKNEYTSYLAMLNNLFGTLLILGKYSELLTKLESFKNYLNVAIKSNNEFSSGMFNIYYAYLLGVYIDTGDFDKAVQLVPSIEAGIKQRSKELHKGAIITFYANISFCYFGAGKYKPALFWLNKILNQEKISIRQDVYSFAKIFNLIIHYELGNEHFLDYAVKSTYRYLYKRKELYAFEKIILDFIRKKISKLDSKKRQIAAFIALKKELLEISKDPLEKSVFENFDFISWLESKITGRLFGEIVKEKAIA